LRIQGVEEAVVVASREILQLAYKVGFISDTSTWLQMLKKRKLSIHIYSEDKADELVSLIRDRFISTFTILEEKLKAKIDNAANELWFIPQQCTYSEYAFRYRKDYCIDFDRFLSILYISWT
jgi:hypothetical protein